MARVASDSGASDMTLPRGLPPSRACPVCAQSHASVMQSMRFALPDGHPLPDAYDVIVCRACGAVYADTSALQSDYDRYYAELSKYSDVATGTGAGQQAWDRDRLHSAASWIAETLGRKDARIVDIGCANGGLLDEFRELGFSALTGVDPSPACVAAVTASGMQGHVGTLFDLPNAVKGADCVILSHVMEHVRDVDVALSAVRGMLEPNGIVYVEVPDATRYAEFIVAPFQDFNVEHINHFSVATLGNALRRAGFRVERTIQKSINASATALYPALGIIARAAADETEAGDPDLHLEANVSAYIARSQSALESIRTHLNRALADEPRIIIWGTGQTTLTLLSNLSLRPEIVALTDSNPRYHGRRLGGIRVIPPEEVGTLDAPILIGSLISHVAIEARVRELGLPNRTIRLS